MTRTVRRLSALALAVVAAPLVAPLAAAEPVDYDMVTRIRQEGLRRSQVMETLTELVDGYGPRLTGSPQQQAASDWAQAKLAGWGLVNAHQETYPFRAGWSYKACDLRVVAPFAAPLHALPLAWTVGTAGPVRAAAMKVKLAAEEDLEPLRGKVRGKILVVEPVAEEVRGREPSRDADDPTAERPFRRYDDDSLREVGAFRIPGDRPEERRREQGRKRWAFTEARNRFLVEEGVVATVENSTRENGILWVTGGGGGGWPGRSPGVPGLVLMEEQFLRLTRALDEGKEVELALDVVAELHDAPEPQAANVVAEIPGSDKAGEIVMVGAHLDSWHAGVGATDDGAGTAVVMEAARILQALGTKPRRTIRFALWSGEEQGLLGSRAYVKSHFATRPKPMDPEVAALPDQYWGETWPLSTLPEHAKLSVYFNLDNGSGKIRGVYAQENAAAVPIFEAWLAPFADLGATLVTMRNTGGTDHQAFDAVGLPGFQFVQDGLEYMSRTWHTDLDTLDHASREDLMQAATVMASFAYHAAMRPEPFPRKPMPTPPPAGAKRSESGGRPATAPATPAAAGKPATPPKPPSGR